MGAGLKVKGPPAMMMGNGLSLSLEKSGMLERSSMLRTLVRLSSYWREKPTISNWLRGMDDSREERGTLLLLRTFSMSTQGAKALSQATSLLVFKI